MLVHPEITPPANFYHFRDTTSATGRIGFNNRAPDEMLRGLQLNGVTGIADCGERDDCDTLFITGFTTRAVAYAAMAAAREGRAVT